MENIALGKYNSKSNVIKNEDITTEYRQTPLDVNNLLSVSNKKKLFSFPLGVFQ